MENKKFISPRVELYDRHISYPRPPEGANWLLWMVECLRIDKEAQKKDKQ